MGSASILTLDDRRANIRTVKNQIKVGPHASVPYHVVETYLAKLISADCKVARVEQACDEAIKGLTMRETTSSLWGAGRRWSRVEHRTTSRRKYVPHISNTVTLDVPRVFVPCIVIERMAVVFRLGCSLRPRERRYQRCVDAIPRLGRAANDERRPILEAVARAIARIFFVVIERV